MVGSVSGRQVSVAGGLGELRGEEDPEVGDPSSAFYFGAGFRGGGGREVV